MAATAKVILLEGNPKNPESAEHIIKFPGGSISVCRTQDNDYWAHIEVYRPEDGPAWQEQGVRERAHGTISEIRIDTSDGVKQIFTPDADHFAVLISTDSNRKQVESEPDRQLKMF